MKEHSKLREMAFSKVCDLELQYRKPFKPDQKGLNLVPDSDYEGLTICSQMFDLSSSDKSRYRETCKLKISAYLDMTVKHDERFTF